MLGGGELIILEPECEKHVFEAISDILYAIAPDRRFSKGYTFKLFNGMIK